MLKQDGDMVHELQRTLCTSSVLQRGKSQRERESLEFHELFHHLASACDLTLMQRLKKMKSYGWRETKPTKNIGDCFLSAFIVIVDE